MVGIGLSTRNFYQEVVRAGSKSRPEKHFHAKRNVAADFCE